MKRPKSARPPHPGELAKAGKIAFSDHALDRMQERGIDLGDILEIFALGDIEGEIWPGKRRAEWSCLVVGKLAWTSRETGVATAVVRKDRLIVVTTEWMDP